MFTITITIFFIAKSLEKKINNIPGIFSFVVGMSY